jgi:hydrogenase maturation factor HypE
MQDAVATSICKEQMHPLRRVAMLTDGYSGSELQTIVKECIVLCWQRREETVKQRRTSVEIAKAAEVQEADLIRSIFKVHARISFFPYIAGFMTIWPCHGAVSCMHHLPLRAVCTLDMHVF